ncbi:hypothetical protein [Erythrobacter sp. JK5]|uniref:hypothetical protein n=1 Tax=Erythrobacter sp. JK5 TaxID=2829500 RepID=UPI001BA83871|nr:hypothetical protein [Erythrobacter sp. JK5]QUL36751.1 hypothetical protein KDC96_10010 [Erythrobacter sp. JK5]
MEQSTLVPLDSPHSDLIGIIRETIGAEASLEMETASHDLSTLVFYADRSDRPSRFIIIRQDGTSACVAAFCRAIGFVSGAGGFGCKLTQGCCMRAGLGNAPRPAAARQGNSLSGESSPVDGPAISADPPCCCNDRLEVRDHLRKRFVDRNFACMG